MSPTELLAIGLGSGMVLGLAGGYIMGWFACKGDLRAKIEAIEQAYLQVRVVPPTRKSANKTLGGAFMAAKNGTARVGSTER